MMSETTVKTYTKEELAAVIETHRKWRFGNEKRAKVTDLQRLRSGLAGLTIPASY